MKEPPEGGYWLWLLTRLLADFRLKRYLLRGGISEDRHTIVI
ncbi:hypothetical protein [Cupriavidus basilensis]|nr:hypothetical protein [Cupriavidus basilensis]